MQRSGRVLTLYSAYGADTVHQKGNHKKQNVSRKAKKDVPCRPCDVNKENTVRDATILTPRPPTEPKLLKNRIPTAISERVKPIVGNNITEKETVADGGQSEATRVKNPQDDKNTTPRRTRCRPSAPQSMQDNLVLEPTIPSPPRSPSNRGTDESANPIGIVMSLYGDGFVEIPPHPSPTTMLIGPFSIKVRLFKAEDDMKIQNPKGSETSRHQHPELNDSGEFLRWMCCGSTDRNVYGCLASSNKEDLQLPIETMLQLHPPKLIAAKLSSNEGDTESLRFVVYDRGLPISSRRNELIDEAVNAGCRVWWNGLEFWAVEYEIPSNRWVDFVVTFDEKHLLVYIDGELVDAASATCGYESKKCRVGRCMFGCLCLHNPWTLGSSIADSICIGGYSKYSVRVEEWRIRAGFIGLIASIQVWSCPFNFKNEIADKQHVVVHAVGVDVGLLRDLSKYKRTIHVHRNVFWRKQFPPFMYQETDKWIVLLENFYHGSHHDVSTFSSKSFDLLLAHVLQISDVRIRIERSIDFDRRLGFDSGCRSVKEYEMKCNEFVREIERLSPLLMVVVCVNTTPTIGQFEVFIELCRSLGSEYVSIPLHSMLATTSFPKAADIRNKISEVISHEAKRPPCESVAQQAFRYFLSLVDQSRDNNERAFLEAIINRKAVITEKRICTIFQRFGFYFSQPELSKVIEMFRKVQDDFFRHQSRIDDIPTMSLLTPTSSGMYRLPLLRSVAFSCITPYKRTVSKSPWRFMAIVLDYDLQLLDFIHEGSPKLISCMTTYSQSRCIHDGFLDRLHLNISELPAQAYCVLFTLQKVGTDFNTVSIEPIQPAVDSTSHFRRKMSASEIVVRASTSSKQCQRSNFIVQFDNGETFQPLAKFETKPNSTCRWFSLASLYRSRKSNMWLYQALGSSGQATTIHACLEELNPLLIERRIVQVYEVVIAYHDGPEHPEYGEFTRQFSKNIRFGRNGRIVIKSISAVQPSVTHTDSTGARLLEISLCLQGLNKEINVYSHKHLTHTLPTIQSVCRSILHILAEHGIKESLQQNPFNAGSKKIKRPVTIRVVSEDANQPIKNAHVLIENSSEAPKGVATLARKIVPTMVMGSQLVAYHKRLQVAQYNHRVRSVATTFISRVIQLGIRCTIIGMHKDFKLLRVSRAHALLRRVMLQRYNQTKAKILESVSESERSRIYSKSAPIRLQQLYRHVLSLSPSEQNLMADVTAHKADAWKEDPKPIQKNEPILVKPIEETAVQEAIEHTSEEPKKNCVLQTDDNGIISCKLSPGSYSVFIFHTDYIEWLSLIVIFPSTNTSGPFSGAPSGLAPQELVVPLQEFKWSYTIQLVDFYEQPTLKSIGNVPLLITNTCTLDHRIVMTDASGVATWEVSKGLYSVTAKANNFVLYSGSKNVIVDGPRFTTAATVMIPVVVGKMTTEITIISALKSLNTDESIARVEFVDTTSIPIGDRGTLPSNENWPDDTDNDDIVEMIVGSSNHFDIAIGTYTVKVETQDRKYFPIVTTVNVNCNTIPADSRLLFVLCPKFHQQNVFYVVFSYINGSNCMNAMIQMTSIEASQSICWRHNMHIKHDDVAFHGTHALERCEYQAFTITCNPGTTYKCIIASHICTHDIMSRFRPHIQVYNFQGLVYDYIQDDDKFWRDEFYWTACEWDAEGKFTPRAC